MNSITINFAGLRPITPAHSNRYTKSRGASISCKKLPAGCFSRQGEPEPLYLPSGWSNHIQAEGQTYFFQKNARFATETNIYDAGKYKQIAYWMVIASGLAEAQNMAITESVEIVLQPDEDNEASCGYYVVDHETATVYWFQEVTSEELEIPDSVSLSQLRWNSNELYWTHVEYFSAHLDGLRMSTIRELHSILSHARADHLTSMVGTFPYTAGQCKEFQDLLRDHAMGSSEILSDKYIICVVARLWAQVARHRFLNYYGEECARLSRDQRIVNTEPSMLPFMLRVLQKCVLFDIPRNYAVDLESYWVDNIVYGEPWKVFMKQCISDWNETAAWTVALTSLHALIYFAPMASSTASVTALALSTFGFISSMGLSNYHRMPTNHEALSAASYLDQTCHPRYGFAPLSWIYSIPKAVLLWSAGLIIFQGGFALFEVLPISNPYVAGSVAGLTVTVLLGVAYVLRVQEALFSWIPFLRQAHRDEDLERNDGAVDGKF